MSSMNQLLGTILQVVVMLLFAPLLTGVIRKIKAVSQHRKGASVFQLYFDIIKLFRKDMVISESSSWIFRVTPYIFFAATVAASSFVPVIVQLQGPGFIGDIILAVYLLGMGRVFVALAGLDAAGTFGGMGSSREMMISSIIEPSFIVALFTLGMLSRSTSYRSIIEHSAGLGPGLIQPVYFLTFCAIVIILLAETARIPVDDPATHLELTMVHEAMLLEYSGRYLALIQWGASVKQLIFVTILVNVFIPFWSMAAGYGGITGFILSLGIYFLTALLVSVLIACIEIRSTKLRLFSVPNLAALSFILSLLGFLSYFVLGR